MAPCSSTLAWKLPWTEEPGRLQSMGSRQVGHGTRLSDFTFTFHFHALEKEMATHSSVLAWRIPGTGEPGGLPSMGSHRVGHDWSDLADLADGTNCLEIYELKIVNISCTVSGVGSGIQEGLAEWSGSPPGGCSHLRFSRTAGWGSSSFYVVVGRKYGPSPHRPLHKLASGRAAGWASDLRKRKRGLPWWASG